MKCVERTSDIRSVSHAWNAFCLLLTCSNTLDCPRPSTNKFLSSSVTLPTSVYGLCGVPWKPHDNWALRLRAKCETGSTQGHACTFRKLSSMPPLWFAPRWHIGYLIYSPPFCLDEMLQRSEGRFWLWSWGASFGQERARQVCRRSYTTTRPWKLLT